MVRRLYVVIRGFSALSDEATRFWAGYPVCVLRLFFSDNTPFSPRGWLYVGLPAVATRLCQASAIISFIEGVGMDMDMGTGHSRWLVPE